MVQKKSFDCNNLSIILDRCSANIVFLGDSNEVKSDNCSDKLVDISYDDDMLKIEDECLTHDDHGNSLSFTLSFKGVGFIKYWNPINIYVHKDSLSSICAKANHGYIMIKGGQADYLLLQNENDNIVVSNFIVNNSSSINNTKGDIHIEGSNILNSGLIHNKEGEIYLKDFTLNPLVRVENKSGAIKAINSNILDGVKMKNIFGDIYFNQCICGDNIDLSSYLGGVYLKYSNIGNNLLAKSLFGNISLEYTFIKDAAKICTELGGFSAITSTIGDNSLIYCRGKFLTEGCYYDDKNIRLIK